jgi:hypothetical protein
MNRADALFAHKSPNADEMRFLNNNNRLTAGCPIGTVDA